MSSHHTDIHDVVAVVFDRGQEYDHVNIVSSDGSIFRVSLYHLKDLRVLYRDVTRGSVHANSNNIADFVATSFKIDITKTTSAEVILAYQQIMESRLHSDRDFSGGSLPEVGSIRESEERNC